MTEIIDLEDEDAAELFLGFDERPVDDGHLAILPAQGRGPLGAVQQALGVSRQSVNELLRERRAVSPEMALRLGRLFGNSPEFWLNAQRAVDLWDAAQTIKNEVARIEPLDAA